MHFGAPEESPKYTSLEPSTIWPPGGSLPPPHFIDRVALSQLLTGPRLRCSQCPPPCASTLPARSRSKSPPEKSTCSTDEWPSHDCHPCPQHRGLLWTEVQNVRVQGPPWRWHWAHYCLCLNFQEPMKKMILRKDIQRAMLPIWLSKSWLLIF